MSTILQHKPLANKCSPVILLVSQLTRKYIMLANKGRSFFYLTNPSNTHGRSLQPTISTAKHKLLQWRQLLQRQQNLDCPRLARHASNQTLLFKSEHHLVDSWRRDLEITLHIGVGRWTAVYLGVVINESQILSLFFGVSRHSWYYPECGFIFQLWGKRPSSSPFSNKASPYPPFSIN